MVRRQPELENQTEGEKEVSIRSIYGPATFETINTQNAEHSKRYYGRIFPDERKTQQIHWQTDES